MKKVLFILAMMLTAAVSMAQTTTAVVTNDDYEGLTVQFTSGRLTAHAITMNAQPFVSLEMDNMLPSQKIGEANLPTFSSLIEVPLCQGFTIEVRNAVFDTIDITSLGVSGLLTPRQPSRSKSDTTIRPIEWNKDTYATDAFMGDDLARVEQVGIARDRNLARLQISPLRYNAVQGKIIICRQAEVMVRYQNADRTATEQMFERYHTPAFSAGATLNSLYPKSIRTASPVRYLIVAHSMFAGQLDDFVAWKRRKGFLTDIVYTSNPAVGTTSESIAAYIQSQYTNATAANPAPTYLLLVGDHEQIPAFDNQAFMDASTDHITDLYYTCWTTGDHIPDCYYGRFSAQTVDQLTPQVQKTLMYEQYTFADPSFLDRAVMVAGVDGGNSGDYGYTHADPAMDYAITHYINGANGFSDIHYFKNNTSIVPTATNLTIGTNASSNSATVRNYYNQGAGWINYSAHGSATSWGTPNFTTSHAAAMTNTQKFGLMIGNCCLTNKFETTTCLGEALLRKGNYCGAVGYIGGTNSTYWYEDFYWAVGVRSSSSIGASMSMAYDASHLGNYDRMCHTHSETHSQWVETQGALVVNGNTIVESSTSSANMKYYYWEIYQLMGDPALMPYRTQASLMTLSAPDILPCGTTTLTVQAVPYAYVAMTDTLTHTLVNATFADATGHATLTIPAGLPVGGYEICASAQQYRTAFKSLILTSPNGPYVAATIDMATPHAGEVSSLSGKVVNLGTSTAHNITVHFACTNAGVTLLADSLYISYLAAGDTVVLDAMTDIMLDPMVEDMTQITISTNASCDSAITNATIFNTLMAHAPHLVVEYINCPNHVFPNGNYTLNVKVSNLGHMDMASSNFELTCPIHHATLFLTDSTPMALAAGANQTRTFILETSPTTPYNIILPIEASFSNPFIVDNPMLNLPVGLPLTETFEGMVFHTTGWTQGSYPWQITNSESHGGNYCARSASTLTHNQTSQMTLTRTFAVNDSISFYYKVSSEANYDKFFFKIDGIEMVNASGTVNWTHAAFPIEAGTHTFDFIYSKDGSVNTGSDCVWIDDVRMPQQMHNWSLANDTICYGEELIVMGDTIDTHTIGAVYATDTTHDEYIFIQIMVNAPQIIDTTITVCDNYEWNGLIFTESATFSDTIAVDGGCPIYMNYDIRINHSSTEEFEAVACDSLMMWGESFTASGAYNQLFVNQFGCDSLVTMHLTINQSVVDSLALTLPNGPFFWNNETYNTSGTYTQYFQTTEGCDSIVVLTLELMNENQGIDNTFENQQIQVYPNPSNGKVYFSQQVDQIEIYDMTGRRLIVVNDADKADLSTLADGIYTMRMKLNNGTCTQARLIMHR